MEKNNRFVKYIDQLSGSQVKVKSLPTYVGRQM